MQALWYHMDYKKSRKFIALLKRIQTVSEFERYIDTPVIQKGGWHIGMVAYCMKRCVEDFRDNELAWKLLRINNVQRAIQPQIRKAFSGTQVYPANFYNLLKKYFPSLFVRLTTVEQVMNLIASEDTDWNWASSSKTSQDQTIVYALDENGKPYKPQVTKTKKLTPKKVSRVLSQNKRTEKQQASPRNNISEQIEQFLSLIEHQDFLDIQIGSLGQNAGDILFDVMKNLVINEDGVAESQKIVLHINSLRDKKSFIAYMQDLIS